MKKIKFLLLSVFAVLFFVSCSSDDNESGIDTTLILGKWYKHSVIHNGETYPVQQHEDCKDYWEFFEDGTLKWVIIWDCAEQDEDIATYSISGNTLTTNYNDQVSLKIITLTNSELILEGSEGGNTLRTKFTRN